MSGERFIAEALIFEQQQISSKQYLVKVMTHTGHWVQAVYFAPSSKSKSHPPLSPLWPGCAYELQFELPKYPHWPLGLKEWHCLAPHQALERSQHYLAPQWWMFLSRLLASLLTQLTGEDFKSITQSGVGKDRQYVLMQRLLQLFHHWSYRPSIPFNTNHLYLLRCLTMCKLAMIQGILDLDSWLELIDRQGGYREQQARWRQSLTWLVPLRLEDLWPSLQVLPLSEHSRFDWWLWTQLGLKEKSFIPIENIVFYQKNPTIDLSSIN